MTAGLYHQSHRKKIRQMSKTGDSHIDLDVRPLTPLIGAEIGGIDLREPLNFYGGKYYFFMTNI
jgi:hypothetical protein